MAENEFGIEYAGPALDDGIMPVRELAPALLAMGELVATASRVVYPDREPVALNIKAYEPGSFILRLILESQDSWDNVIDLAGSHGADALANFKDLVIGPGIGLIWLIRRIRNGKIAKHEEVLPPGTIKITLPGGTTIEIPVEVWTLYQNIEIRRRAEQVVEPLRSDGVDSVTFVEDSTTPPVVITKDDLPAFAVPKEIGGDALEQEIRLLVEISTVAFKGGKWKLSDGDRTFFATIEDEAFLERVDGGEAFSKGDSLLCRIRIVQTRRPAGLHTEWTVLDVLDHIPRPTQFQFPFDDAGE